eukprot:jgi/Tetstr1/462853/TSEL_007802.t1
MGKRFAAGRPNKSQALVQEVHVKHAKRSAQTTDKNGVLQQIELKGHMCGHGNFDYEAFKKDEAFNPTHPERRSVPFVSSCGSLE